MNFAGFDDGPTLVLLRSVATGGGGRGRGASIVRKLSSREKLQSNL